VPVLEARQRTEMKAAISEKNAIFETLTELRKLSFNCAALKLLNKVPHLILVSGANGNEKRYSQKNKRF
jgi:hypothetical protein